VKKSRILLECEIRLIHHFDPPQPFHLIDALHAGHHEPRGKPLVRTDRLAILTYATITSSSAFGSGTLFRASSVSALRDDPFLPRP
jgi:hypothetical protein